jgi:outer membrane protein assembly factor BamE (lipoprotein component of BamABCDE complex)
LRILAAVLIIVIAGCAQYTDKRGVEVTWQPEVVESFRIGETTRSDVLKELGPPSQVITLDDETVLYYLYEKREGQGYILIVYNRFEVETEYDRAVFFFDGNDRLTEYASHINPEDDD